METNLVVKYQLFSERGLSMEQASSMILHFLMRSSIVCRVI